VFTRSLLGGLAALLLAAQAPAVMAQVAPTDSRPSADSDNRPDRSVTERRTQRGAGRAEARPQAPAAPSPEAVLAAAQAQVTSAGLDCQVAGAANPGMIGEHQVYEVACASAPGYILIASTPPQAFNCLELAGTAWVARRTDPAADAGQQCVLPANQNGLALVSEWAREAGASCTVDEAVAVGKNETNGLVYEVGCTGVDGYRLEKVDGRWTLQDCLQIVSGGGTCHFTTAEEQNATLQAKLAGTEAAGCSVQQVRLMGSNANGRFFEVKCAAEGEGYIARLKDGATQQIYPCATAQRIGGGCTLTPAPAAAPAAEQ